MLDWRQLPAQHGEQRGLARAVGADDCDAGAQRQPSTDILEDQRAVLLVPEVAVLHLQDGLRCRGDSVEFPWNWEVEPHITLRSLDGLSGLGHHGPALGLQDGLGLVAAEGRLLEEAVEVSRVVLQLLLVKVDNIRADCVEEFRLVGDDQGCPAQAIQVLAKPINRSGVQVVCRLVKEQHIAALHHHAGKCQAHAPSSAQLPQRFRLHVGPEADGFQCLSSSRTAL
mmetsp:Transcript_72072/g.215074  ORF Transcript_72072/g.215074 Transcript_72072/m.215074 type:complete len:226 (+) Transcript_72072:780-1457(+)